MIEDTFNFLFIQGVPNDAGSGIQGYILAYDLFELFADCPPA